MANPRELEAMSQFLKFMEVLSDPAKLTDVMTTLKGDIAQLEQANGIYKSLQSVKEKAEADAKYLARENEILANKEAALKEREAELDKRVGTVRESLAAEREENAATRARLDAEAVVQAKTQAELAERMAKAAEKEDQLKRREDMLVEREYEASMKAEKLKALLG